MLYKRYQSLLADHYSLKSKLYISPAPVREAELGEGARVHHSASGAKEPRSGRGFDQEQAAEKRQNRKLWWEVERLRLNAEQVRQFEDATLVWFQSIA